MSLRRYLWTILFGAVCFSWIGLWNGFPLMPPDASGYIERAFSLTPAAHQPIWYSLWIKLTALHSSLWLTVFAQNLLLSLCLTALAVEIFGLSLLHTLGSLLVLAAFSPLPWYSNQVMADAFAPILVFSAFLWLKTSRVLWFLLMTLAISVHFSHWCLSLFWLPLAWKISKRKAIALIVTLLAIWSATRLYNLHFVGDAAVQRRASAFLMGRMYETGLLEKYLLKHCPSPSLQLCNATAPRRGPINDFIWNRTSIHFELSDDRRSPEYRQIFAGVAREFPLELAWESLLSVIRQSYRFATGDAVAHLGPEDTTASVLKKHFPSHVSGFLNSRQQRKQLDFNPWNVLHIVLVLGSVLIIASRTKTPTEKQWYYFLMLSLAANAIICGTLTGAFHRYQGRLIGLVIAGAIFLLAKNTNKVTSFAKRYCDRPSSFLPHGDR